MSSIDRRVVEMEFDNKQFERGVQQTLKSLEDLKKGLQLDGATKGLEAVSEKGRRFNLDNMASALDNISDKFSIMGAVGFAVIQRFTNAAIDYAKKIKGLVFDPLVAGGRRRALNIEQAKFMFRGLGMDIEEAMANALYAVQGTAFGLDEAARAASQLGASQVQLGDDMRQALRGISGVAAMTNSSYEDTARIFTRVAGQGRVMAVDLNSIAARGLNAAAVLAEAMGTTEAKIREMVSEGQITFDIFSKAMDDAFGENATKANETYTGSLANLRAALARIGAAFFTPHLENMRDLFNAITPAIDAMHNALKPVIKTMTDFSGKTTGRMIKALETMDFDDFGLVISPALGIFTNILRIMGEVIRPIRDAFRQIFPPTSMKQIGGVLSLIEEFVSKIKMGAETTENLRRTFAGVFAVFSIGWTIFKEFAKFLADIFGLVFEGSGGFLAATANVGDFLVALDQAIKNGEGISNFFKGLGDALQRPIKFIKELTRAFLTLFDFEAPSVERITLTLEPLGRLGEIAAAAWRRVLDSLKEIWHVFLPLAERMRPFFQGISRIINESFQNIDYGDVLDTIKTGLLGGLLLAVKRFAKDFSGSFGSGIHRLTAPFAKLTYTLNTMQSTLRAMTLMQIALAVGILTASVIGLSKVDSGGLTKALSAISVMFAQLFATMAGFQRLGGMVGMAGLGSALILFATGVRILTSSVRSLAKLSWEELSIGLTGLTAMMTTLVGVARTMAGHTAGMITAGIGLTALAVGIRILVGAVTRLSGLSWEEIGKGLVAVGGLLTSLAIFTRLVAANKAGVLQGTGLLLLAAAIKVLASAVGDFAAMSWEDISKGLASVTGILAAFAIFSHALDPKGLVRAGVSLVLIGASMKILASAFSDFAGMSWEELGKGLATMAGALTAIVLALNLMPKSTVAKALALIGVATALNLIAIALAKMGGMTWEEIGKGLTTLAGALGLIAVAMLAMNTALPGAAATLIVANALLILTPVLKILGGMSWEEIVRGLTTLAGVFVVLGVAGLVLAPIVPVIIKLGLAVALIGVGMLAAGVGTLAFAAALTALSLAGAGAAAALVAVVSAIVGLLPVIAKQVGLAIIVLINTIAEAAPAMARAMGLIILAIIQLIRDVTPDIIHLFSDMLSELIHEMSVAVPKMARAAYEMMIGILQALNDKAPIIVREIINLITAIFEEMAAGIPKMARAGTDMLVAYLTAIASHMDEVVTAGADIIITFIQALSDNSVRIVDEGMKAVINFLNGVADAIRDNTPELQAAGRNIAGAIVSGLTGGLSDRVGEVAAGARSLARGALDAAGRVLRTGSPSKAFEELGHWVGEGFANGLVGSRAGVIAAWETTTNLLERAMDSSAREVERLEAKLEKLNEAKKRDVEAIKETEIALANARSEYDRSNEALERMNTGLSTKRERLEELGEAYDNYTTKLNDAEKALEDAIRARDQHQRSIEQQFGQLPRIGEDTTLDEFVDDLKDSKSNLKEFSDLMSQLKDLGLADELYEEFLRAGTSIIPFLRELVEGGKQSIQVVNTLTRQIVIRAERLGYFASRALHQAGIDSMQGLIEGIQSQRSELEAEMERIAAIVTETLRLKLELQSPSRVTYKIGEHTVQGMVDGIKKTAPLLGKAVSDVGDDVIDSMKTSIAGLSDILSADMDLNPTITPVLDLSSFDRDAAYIDSTFAAKKLQIDLSHAKARNASSGYLANEDARSIVEKAKDAPVAQVTYNQYNQSPKALSSAEIYRQTKNQLSRTKGALTPNVAEDA